jgi:hypothetical protein
LTCLAWHSTGNEIAAGYADGELAFWSVRTSDLLLRTFGNFPSQHTLALSFQIFFFFLSFVILFDVVTPDSGKRSPVTKISINRDGFILGFYFPPFCLTRHPQLLKNKKHNKNRSGPDKRPSDVMISGGTLEYEPIGLILLKGNSFFPCFFFPCFSLTLRALLFNNNESI